MKSKLIEMASIDKNKKMPELYINDSIEDLINILVYV